MRSLVPGVSCLAALAGGGVAGADSLNDQLGPREIAVGEALRGGATGAAGVDLNPSGLPLNRELVFEGGYGYRAADSASLIGVSACDSTNALPGCFFYDYAGASPELGGMTMHRTTHVGGFLYMYFVPRLDLLAEAEAASRLALALDPGSAEAHASSGLAFTLRKDFAPADAAFAEAVHLDPRLFEAHYFWARACFQRGDHADALRHFSDACALREDYQAMLLYAQTLEAMGRRAEATEAYARALEVCERHIALNPDDGRALTMGSVGRARCGDRAGAMEWAERALEAEPGDPVILYAAAGTFAVLGLVDRAVETFARAIAHGFANRQWIEEDPDFDKIRGDARFQEVVRGLLLRSGEVRAFRRDSPTR